MPFFMSTVPRDVTPPLSPRPYDNTLSQSWIFETWGITPQYLLRGSLQIVANIASTCAFAIFLAAPFFAAPRTYLLRALFLGIASQIVLGIAEQITDYQNPSYVRELQDKIDLRVFALRLSGRQDEEVEKKEIQAFLPSLVKEHTWKNILYYEVVRFETLDGLCRLWAENIPVTMYIEMYKEAEKAFKQLARNVEGGDVCRLPDSVPLPHPTEFQGRLNQLTLSTCGPDQLFEYRLISFDQCDAVKRLKSEYEEEASRSEGGLGRDESHMRSESRQHAIHAKLRRLRDEEARELFDLEKNHVEGEGVRRAKETLERGKGLADSSDERLTPLRQAYEDAVRADRRAYNERVQRIEAKYEDERDGLMCQLRESQLDSHDTFLDVSRSSVSRDEDWREEFNQRLQAILRESNA